MMQVGVTNQGGLHKAVASYALTADSRLTTQQGVAETSPAPQLVHPGSIPTPSSNSVGEAVEDAASTAVEKSGSHRNQPSDAKNDSPAAHNSSLSSAVAHELPTLVGKSESVSNEHSRTAGAEPESNGSSGTPVTQTVDAASAEMTNLPAHGGTAQQESAHSLVGMMPQVLSHTSAEAIQPAAQSSAPHVEMVQQGRAPAAASKATMQPKSLDDAQRSAQRQSAQHQAAQELPATRAALGTQVPSTAHAAQLQAASSSRAVSAEEVQQSVAGQPPEQQQASSGALLEADAQTEQVTEQQQQTTSQAASAHEPQHAGNAAGADSGLQQSSLQSADEAQDARSALAIAKEQGVQPTSDVSAPAAEQDATLHQHAAEAEEEQLLPGRPAGQVSCHTAGSVMVEEEEQLHEASHLRLEAECQQGSPAKHAQEVEQRQRAASSPSREEGQNPSLLAEQAEEDEEALHASASLVPTTLAGDEDAQQSHSHPVQQDNLRTGGLAQDSDGAACAATDSEAVAPKAKPGFLAQALFCTVASPILVPVLALGTAIQLYEALSLWGALPPAALQ
ncbi:hypothetical protein ABBQ38_009364 [Trebouxia sp. C0009 RCD-2024]